MLMKKPTKTDHRSLRDAGRLLLAEHELVMEEYRNCRRCETCGNNSRPPSDGPCERSIVAMRRLGNFLKTREIPDDIKSKLSDHNSSVP
jgi:hypothetical protein